MEKYLLNRTLNEQFKDKKRMIRTFFRYDARQKKGCWIPLQRMSITVFPLALVIGQEQRPATVTRACKLDTSGAGPRQGLEDCGLSLLRSENRGAERRAMINNGT